MSATLVAVGASLGGLEAISAVLSDLPPSLTAAVAIVQHRAFDSESRLAQMLAARSRLPLREPDDGEPVRPGTAYLAPAGYHLLVEPGRFALSVDAAVTWARPSIDVLFESVADAYGDRAVGVALTGSSEDGARGAAALAATGAVVLVQAPETAQSAVAPGAVLERVSQAVSLPLSEIGPRIAALCEAK